SRPDERSVCVADSLTGAAAERLDRSNSIAGSEVFSATGAGVSIENEKSRGVISSVVVGNCSLLTSNLRSKLGIWLLPIWVLKSVSGLFGVIEETTSGVAVSTLRDSKSN